jgi:hypothetical protein
MTRSRQTPSLHTVLSIGSGRCGVFWGYMIDYAVLSYLTTSTSETQLCRSSFRLGGGTLSRSRLSCYVGWRFVCATGWGVPVPRH